MKAAEIIKLSVGMVASIGAGAIVGNIIKVTTPSTTTKLMKLVIGLGGLVLTGIVGDAASTYVDKTVDDMVNTVNDVKQEVENNLNNVANEEEEDEKAEEA